jgi:hypothetical protein
VKLTALKASETPALLVQGPGRDPTHVYYPVRLLYHVVEWLVHTAVLVGGVGSHQDRVTIIRKADRQ